MMIIKSALKVLELTHIPQSQGVLRKAYRAALKKWPPEEHPDKFKEVREAYEAILEYARDYGHHFLPPGSYGQETSFNSRPRVEVSNGEVTGFEEPLPRQEDLRAQPQAPSLEDTLTTLRGHARWWEDMELVGLLGDTLIHPDGYLDYFQHLLVFLQESVEKGDLESLFHLSQRFLDSPAHEWFQATELAERISYALLLHSREAPPLSAQARQLVLGSVVAEDWEAAEEQRENFFRRQKRLWWGVLNKDNGVLKKKFPQVVIGNYALFSKDTWPLAWADKKSLKSRISDLAGLSFGLALVGCTGLLVFLSVWIIEGGSAGEALQTIIEYLEEDR